MALNKLSDLNNHLFEALERLNDDELMAGENGTKEIARAKAIADVGHTIIDNANLMLDAVKTLDDMGITYGSQTEKATLKLLGVGEDEQ